MPAAVDLWVPRSVASPVAKARADVSEIGSTGLRQYGGVLAEETIPALTGIRQVQTYAEMAENEPILGGVLMAIDNMVRSVEWSVEPAEDNGEGRRWAEHVESCLWDMSTSWPDIVSEIFSMIVFGWYYTEVVPKHRNGAQPDKPGAKASSRYDDGLVGWRKFAPRSQESLLRWEFDDNDGIQGLHQQVQGTPPQRFIPIQRALLFRTRVRNGSPQGSSVLRNAFRPWWFKRRIEELEGIGIERDLAGLPVFGVPPRMLSAEATPAEKQALNGIKTLVTSVRRNSDEGLVVPRDFDEHGNEVYKLELLSSGSRRQFDLDKVMMRKSQEMAICALADWLLLGHEGVGSRALGSSKIDIFADALDTWTLSVAGVINSHAVPRLMAANGVDRDLAPTIKASRVGKVDLSEFASSVSSLLVSGAISPDDNLEDHVRATAGLPARADAA